MARVSTAFLFPGQGLARDDVVRALHVHHGHALVGALRETLADLAPADQWPAFDMTDTRVAQPTVYVASLLNARFLAQRQDAAAVLGHSLGEITALAFVGAFSDEEGLAIAYRRGAICHEIQMRRPGAMASVLRLSDEAVALICETAGETSGQCVDMAANNGPGHIVLSGDRAAVEEACRLAVAEGGGVVPLQIGGAFHSHLLADAVPLFEAVLAAVSFNDSEIPVVSCATAQVYTDGDSFRELVVEDLIAPVLWADAVAALPTIGIGEAIDVGPGEVLYKIGRRLGGVKCRPMDPIPA